MNSGDRNEHGSLAELREVLGEFDTAMLVTLTDDGMVRARPMAIQDPEALPDCDLWFVASDESDKVGEIEHDDQVGVCCFRDRDRAWISISARARIERDAAAIHRLWRPEWRAWLPAGPDDPSLALLKLDVERAEYFEPHAARVQVLYEPEPTIRRAGQPPEEPKHV
jgi:general stress protein 26